MKTLFAILILSSIQGRTLYEDAEQSVRLSGYTSAEGGTESNGDFSFEAKGNPLTLEARLQGMAIVGPTMTGILGRAVDSKDAKRSISFVRSLDATGGPVVTFDSESRFVVQTEHSKKFKLPPPAPMNSATFAKLRTSELAYRGSESEGTFAIPKPFEVEMHVKGQGKTQVKDAAGKQTQTVAKQFTNEATVSGASATVRIDPSAIGVNQLTSGLIKGVVKLRMKQVETTALAPEPQITMLDGLAEEISFDLKEKRTITLTGNVMLSGNTSVYAGKTEGDQAVIWLDENLKPIRIRITGQPTKSSLREKKSGGGNR